MKNARGFTLLELMTVIAILAIIVGFTPLSMDMIRREQVASATRELIADLQRARIDAMTKDSRGFGVRFDSGAYVIFQFNDCNDDYNYDINTCSGNTREEAHETVRVMPTSVVLKKSDTETDFNGDVRIFDRFGSPRWGKTGGLGGITVVVRNNKNANIARCIKLSVNRIIEGRWTGAECKI